MRTIVASLLALCLVLPTTAGATRPQKQIRRHSQQLRKHGRRPASATLAALSDEVTLTPPLLRKLQCNLVDGGYLRGTIDGRLTHRTRRAIRDFQNEYHLPGTGALDRSTAEALLGHDVVSTVLVAHK